MRHIPICICSTTESENETLSSTTGRGRVLQENVVVVDPLEFVNEFGSVWWSHLLKFSRCLKPSHYSLQIA